MAPAVFDIEDGWPLLPPPCPDEPRLPSAFPLASIDTTKAVTRIWNILSSLSLLFPFDCGLGKSLARTGSRPSPNPAEWDWVTVSMDYACSLCVAGSVCVHTCTRACEHSLRWCTSAFSGLPAAQTKDQVSDGTRLLALTPLDSSLKFSLHQVWVLMGCRPCPWTITLSGRSIYGAPAKRFH